MKKILLKWMKKAFTPVLTFLLVLLFNGTLRAQNPITITGTVKDEKGEVLIGVTVKLEGTYQGTITDINGGFSLKVLPGSSLTFSYIGYMDQKVTVGDIQHFEVTLLPGTVDLQEIVVVGYGRQKKETVTGSIVSVGNKELVQTRVAGISNALIGRVGGLSGTQASGEPGKDAATIRIRGVGTLNGSGQDPLIIIDGVQSNFTIMNAMDGNEIENISVLKDVSATAIYGVKGANGVIIVTTKRGKSGAPMISFSSSYGIIELASKLKMLGSYDYALFRNEAIRNDNDPSFDKFLFNDDQLWKFKNNRDYTEEEVSTMNLTPAQKTALLASPALYYTSHDYFKEQFGGASAQQQSNLNVSGGIDGLRYFTSLGYFSQNGVFENSGYGGANINSNYNRYNMRSNFDIDLAKTLKASVDVSGQFASNGGILGAPADGDITGDYSRHKAMLVNILSSSPFSGPGIVDGHLVTSFVNNTNPLQALGSSGYSPIAYLLSRPYLTSYNSELNANIKLTHIMDYLIKGLSLSGTASYNNMYTKGIYRFQPIPQYSATRNPDNPGEVLFFGGAKGPATIIDNYNNNKWRQLYFETAVNYNSSFGKHAVTALLLYNAQKTFNPGLLYNVPAGLIGLAGRATYNFDQRYLMEINIGYNGSENFPEGKRFGFFPAFSAGWVISNEKIIPENDLLTWLKIRGSYGEVGNDQIGGRRYLYLPSTWGYGGNYAFGGYYFGNTNGGSQDPYYTGATENTVGNPDVTWERARKVNFGLEANFFKNRLSFIGDIFSEKRDNILWALGTIPGIVGANLPPANIGKVSNKGYELQAGWDDKIGNLVYNIKGNVSYARNKIEFMDEPSYPYEWMNTTGFSIGQYKGLKTNGFYNTAEEAASHPYSNIDGNKVQAGDIRYIDISGDGVIDSRDNVPIGYSNLPRYAFSSTISLDYKGFSLSVIFTGTAQGSILMTNFYMLNPFYQTNGSAMEWQYEGRWTPEKAAAGLTPTFPRASLRTYSTQNGVGSDFWLNSTDHIRLKNVEIGYTFSKLDLLRKTGVKGIRLFVNGNNLYTWSHMIDGFDPEQQDSGGAGAGYLYPMTRIFNLGINVQF